MFVESALVAMNSVKDRPKKSLALTLPPSSLDNNEFVTGSVGRGCDVVKSTEGTERFDGAIRLDVYPQE